MKEISGDRLFPDFILKVLLESNIAPNFLFDTQLNKAAL
jgi:hypothetical protein